MHLLSSLVVYLPLVLPFVHGTGISPGAIKNLVTFGDSYTDIIYTGDHGTAWPVYAAGYANLSLHSYAIAGSSCDKRLTPQPDPDYYIVQHQIPFYFNDTEHGLKLNPEETLYTLWIGTNDVGNFGLLSGKQTEGTTIVQVAQCAVSWVKTLYDSGARNFLFQNVGYFASPSVHSRSLMSDGVDDPTRACTTLPQRRNPFSILAYSTQPNRMESFYDGACSVGQRNYPFDT